MKTTKKFIAFICIFVMAVSLVTITADAARVGDVIGYAQPTDIVATINGYQLESYNVEGYTYICVEDLRYYGFDVYYDNYTRTLSVNRNYSVDTIDAQNTNPKFWSIGSNNTRKNILYTDITTYVNGNYVPSCNINGQTIIQFDHLKEFGAVNYDDSKREISLIMDGIPYNLVASYADYLHEGMGYHENWKIIIRAKGSLVMLIATAREYADSNVISDYKNNKIPEDKEFAREILDAAVSEGLPVSSVYFEYRNSNGNLITSFQID